MNPTCKSRELSKQLTCHHVWKNQQKQPSCWCCFLLTDASNKETQIQKQFQPKNHAGKRCLQSFRFPDELQPIKQGSCARTWGLHMTAFYIHIHIYIYIQLYVCLYTYYMPASAHPQWRRQPLNPSTDRITLEPQHRILCPGVEHGLFSLCECSKHELKLGCISTHQPTKV